MMLRHSQLTLSGERVELGVALPHVTNACFCVLHVLARHGRVTRPRRSLSQKALPVTWKIETLRKSPNLASVRHVGAPRLDAGVVKEWMPNYVGNAITAACHRPDRFSSWKACTGASLFGHISSSVAQLACVCTHIPPEAP